MPRFICPGATTITPVALAKHLGKIRSRLPAWCLPELLERMSAMRN